MKIILTNSLLASAVSIIIFFIIHFIDPSLNFSLFKAYLSGLVIYLFFLIRAGRQQRKKLGGFIGFGEVFVSSIAIIAIASFISAIFSYLMFLNNPEFIELAKETTNQMMESTLSMVGMSAEQIALEIEEANEKQDPDQYTSLSTLPINWLGPIIFPGLIYALIASLIVKKTDKSIS